MLVNQVDFGQTRRCIVDDTTGLGFCFFLPRCPVAALEPAKPWPGAETCSYQKQRPSNVSFDPRPGATQITSPAVRTTCSFLANTKGTMNGASLIFVVMLNIAVCASQFRLWGGHIAMFSTRYTQHRYAKWLPPRPRPQNYYPLSPSRSYRTLKKYNVRRFELRIGALQKCLLCPIYFRGNTEVRQSDGRRQPPCHIYSCFAPRLNCVDAVNQRAA